MVGRPVIFVWPVVLNECMILFEKEHKGVTSVSCKDYEF